MNNEQIQAEVEAIKAARADKGGRMSNEEKAQIEHLEAMLNIPENAAMEGAEATVEPPEAPTEPIEGNGRIVSANLTVPTPEGTRNYPEGTVVSVPDEFLAAMIEADRMEPA